jgi:hypothetical protein
MEDQDDLSFTHGVKELYSKIGRKTIYASGVDAQKEMKDDA